PGIAHRNGNGNVVAARAKGNANGNNVRPRRRDVAYLQTQLLIAQKDEVGIQLQAEEFDLMAAAMDSAEVQLHDKCYNDEIFNMFIWRSSINELLRANSVTIPYTSNLQIELDRTKECFENCIIKKDNEYAKLWNDWYKKCEECKYDKISYDKAYNDMHQKIERLRSQLGDQKGKSKETPYGSNTLDPLPQKLENENVELEFQDKLHDTIYENAKLRAQLFDKVSDQKDTTKVTSNSVPTTEESKVVDNDKVIALGLFRINPFKNPRVENFVPNKPSKASVRINPITASQPHVISKKVVNSDSNSFSSIGFLGTVRFGNDRVAAILGFDDLQWGNILITRVYFVEGLGHNLFSVRQFCDSDLEQSKTSFKHDFCQFSSGHRSYLCSLSTITTQQPTEGELDLLFEAMYDDHIGGQLPAAPRTVSAAQAPQVLQTPTTTITTTDTARHQLIHPSKRYNFQNTSRMLTCSKTTTQRLASNQRTIECQCS
ncbi:hypothetical protein Tco_0494314, partial [Tanacetum coccineum]